MTELCVETERLMRSWSAADGDRVDAVAQLCRRLYQRVLLCPCGHQPTCRGCTLDKDQIQRAWDATA